MKSDDKYKKFFEMSRVVVTLLYEKCEEDEDPDKDELFFLMASHTLTDLLSYIFLKVQDKKQRIELVKEFCKMADEVSEKTSFMMEKMGVDLRRKPNGN